MSPGVMISSLHEHLLRFRTCIDLKSLLDELTLARCVLWTFFQLPQFPLELNTGTVKPLTLYYSGHADCASRRSQPTAASADLAARRL